MLDFRKGGTVAEENDSVRRLSRVEGKVETLITRVDAVDARIDAVDARPRSIRLTFEAETRAAVGS